jgi:hypothetical protein
MDLDLLHANMLTIRDAKPNAVYVGGNKKK